MKIGYIGDSEYRTVIEHCKQVTLGINEDTEACLVESALMQGPPDLPSLNTSVGIRNLGLVPELQAAFNERHEIVKAYPKTMLYGFISESGLSDMLEMTFSTRFLTGDIGPQVGFSQGTGLAVDSEELELGIPQIREIVTTLKQLEYRGEITFGLTSDFRICSIEYGHFTGGWALYTELSKRSPQENLEWCLGVGSGGQLYKEGIAVVTLLSYPPFPHDTSVNISVKAPAGADKHLYRILYNQMEVAYSAAWGKDIFEAKRRCRKTIDNCKNYNKDIQYRIDYGHGEQFVLSHDRFLAFGGVEPRGKASS